jgi:hypothetical protein
MNSKKSDRRKKAQLAIRARGYRLRREVSRYKKVVLKGYRQCGPLPGGVKQLMRFRQTRQHPARDCAAGGNRCLASANGLTVHARSGACHPEPSSALFLALRRTSSRRRPSPLPRRPKGLSCRSLPGGGRSEGSAFTRISRQKCRPLRCDHKSELHPQTLRAASRPDRCTMVHARRRSD